MHVRQEDVWFVTLTFENYKSPFHAEKMRNSWLSRLNSALMTNNGGQRLRWICASEWQQREVIHFHLLLLGCDLRLLSRKRWESRWNGGKCCGKKGVEGGWARIYDAQLQAALYLSKYLNKDRGGELQWGGAWLGLNAPTSVACGCTGAPKQFGMG